MGATSQHQSLLARARETADQYYGLIFPFLPAVKIPQPFIALWSVLWTHDRSRLWPFLHPETSLRTESIDDRDLATVDYAHLDSQRQRQSPLLALTLERLRSRTNSIIVPIDAPLELTSLKASKRGAFYVNGLYANPFKRHKLLAAVKEDESFRPPLQAARIGDWSKVTEDPHPQKKERHAFLMGEKCVDCYFGESA
ncbi:unnamed protein product [Lepeophtheirus salmonis]|uniref:(salmon louse) hypothetical protein n=1 Tax=Lepeophtheirus salmonis TaxID=72036 RepID=A0A7R8H5V5_LEPSM|nr:unnamed protein product [Lepeophtheirus salmonis]CAF2885052.1 unnamed protein product [Lepeophtheirus salmonis]